MNPFSRFIASMRHTFRRHPAPGKSSPADKPPAALHSAEGWELVDGFNDGRDPEQSLPLVSSAPGGNPPKHIPDVLESSLPAYPVVWAYFISKHFSGAEAERFYNRFQFVYWKSFGIKSIDNWKDLADRWMLRASEQHTKQFTQQKNYDDPL